MKSLSDGIRLGREQLWEHLQEELRGQLQSHPWWLLWDQLQSQFWEKEWGPCGGALLCDTRDRLLEG